MATLFTNCALSFDLMCVATDYTHDDQGHIVFDSLIKSVEKLLVFLTH